MISVHLRRGMAAGLLAGLLAGLFGFVVGEPLLDRSIALENVAHGAREMAASSHGGSGNEEDMFGRGTQKVGLFFATGLSGTFLGGLFGMAFALLRGRMASRSDWGRSLSLAAAAFAGAALLPFLKYPANPPSVGDPSTIGPRTAAYFAMVGASLLAVLVAWQAARNLRGRGVADPVRHLLVGVGFAVVLLMLFVGLPPAPDPGGYPAGLLWSFRLSSVGTELVLWSGLGVVFGLLCERANRKGVA